MKYLLTTALFISTMLTSPVSMAAEKTIKLTVPGMWCASCPYIVRQSLSAVDGIKAVEVEDIDSSAIGTFVVTFDDEITGIDNIRQATANYGYKSTLIQ